MSDAEERERQQDSLPRCCTDCAERFLEESPLLLVTVEMVLLHQAVQQRGTHSLVRDGSKKNSTASGNGLLERYNIVDRVKRRKENDDEGGSRAYPSRTQYGQRWEIAQKHGIDTSKPRGRRAKTAEEKREEQKNQMESAFKLLRQWAHWRFNTCLNRPEIQEPGGSWRPVNDRDLSTYYCRLKESGVKTSANDVAHIIFNRDFTSDYDPFRSYLDELPKWKEGDPDYSHCADAFADYFLRK